MKRIIAVLLASILLGLGRISVANGAKIICNGATGQSISVVIFNAVGEPNATPATIANFDFWIVADGHAPSAKTDLAALATVGTAWDDYKAIHLQSGLYRVDIPDANLDDGVGTCLTIIIDDVVTSNRTVFYEIQLSPQVDVNTVAQEVPETDVVDTLNARIPQNLAMAQIGGTGSYYVKVTDPNGEGPLTHQEGAKAATALSSATWTNTKAGYLDMKISDVNGSGGDANIAISEFVIQDTNVAVAGTMRSFTLTAGKAAADAYAWHLITVTDANDSNRETRLILSYTAGRVVTVNEPFSFTPAVGDTARIWAIGYFRRTRNPLTDSISY